MVATPQPGSVFTGWAGHCTGIGECLLWVDDYAEAVATFAAPEVAARPVDIDGDGRYDPLTDGLLIMRYLFGLTGDALVHDALGADAIRRDPVAVRAYLDDVRPLLDANGNGSSDALVDGLLVLRYMFGLRGASLTTLANVQSGRRYGAQIEVYLDTLFKPLAP